MLVLVLDASNRFALLFLTCLEMKTLLRVVNSTPGEISRARAFDKQRAKPFRVRDPSSDRLCVLKSVGDGSRS